MEIVCQPTFDLDNNKLSKSSKQNNFLPETIFTNKKPKNIYSDIFQYHNKTYDSNEDVGLSVNNFFLNYSYYEKTYENNKIVLDEIKRLKVINIFKNSFSDFKQKYQNKINFNTEAEEDGYKVMFYEILRSKLFDGLLANYLFEILCEISQFCYNAYNEPKINEIFKKYEIHKDWLYEFNRFYYYRNYGEGFAVFTMWVEAKNINNEKLELNTYLSQIKNLKKKEF